MSKTTNIGGRLHSTEVGNVLVGANEVLDDTKQKKQNVINAEVDAEMVWLDQSKQNNLTFDNAPTEDSTNPVTSGGVYAADKVLSDAIEAILLLIPSAATALNKLADMAFVNSSVSTATATFRGTYNVVTDLELAYDATHEQIATKLGQVISEADNNDYAYVQVPVSATSTDIRRTERYKFNGSAWGYEYDLNTSGFTAAQWNAINSGITAVLVSKLTGLPTAEVLATMFAAKQDTLTFDSEPTALSTNPVTSGGVYSAILAVSTALSDYMTATDALIPSEATALNQLADKAYVLAQILAATPSFKGQFTTLADLQAVASPKAGDLGIVRTKDNDGKDVFTFYQYLSDAWNVYYTLSYHPQMKPATTGTTGDYPYNGMGRVELPMNIVEGVNTLTQSMMPTATGGNTIYIIRYDFTLGEDITVPANCVLEFDGGSISGEHTLTGNNTGIQAGLVKIFNMDVTLAGTFANGEFNAEWFGVNNVSLNNDVYINFAISQLNAIGGGTIIISKDVTISDTIWLMSGVSIKGVGTKKRETDAWLNASPQIKCAFSDNNKWMMSVMPNEGVTIPYNALDIATYSTHDLRGIKIENLTLIKVSSAGEYSYSDEAIFGGIRVNYFRGGANLRNVEIIGVKYGLSLSYSHSSDIEMVIIEATACDVFIGATVTVQAFKNCWFKSLSSEYSADHFDFTLTGIDCPPYLQQSDIKTLGICGKSGSSGTGAAFYGCEFEDLDAVGILNFGEWLFDGIYCEGIRKTIIYGTYECRAKITKQLMEAFKGIPILENGYEFGGNDATFVIDGSFPASRCYSTGPGCKFYIIGNRNTLKVSYYDRISRVNNELVFEKNQDKQFVGVGNTLFVRKLTNPELSTTKLVNFTNATGIGRGNSVLYSEIAERFNNMIEGRNVILKYEDGYYESPLTYIENKNIKLEHFSSSSSRAYMSCLPIKNCDVELTYRTGFIQTPTNTTAFKVQGKCKITMGGIYPGTGVRIVELTGDEPVDLVINASMYDTYMDTYAIKNRDFPYPYKVVVNFDDGTTQNTHIYTNTSRPTKGVPVGYCYIENGAPIFYTGSGWVNSSGTAV